MSNRIEFENGSIIEPIGDVRQGMRGKIRGMYIDTEEKNLYIVNYKYKLLEILDSEYETDTILIKAFDNKNVHKYMDKYRQEFIDCGYDMQYSFQKVGEGNFVEV